MICSKPLVSSQDGTEVRLRAFPYTSGFEFCSRDARMLLSKTEAGGGELSDLVSICQFYTWGFEIRFNRSKSIEKKEKFESHGGL